MRKNIAFIIFSLLLIGCQDTPKEKISNESFSNQSEDSFQKKVKPKSSEICWEGSINNKLPIFIHYSIHDNLVTGEITYLNTKSKKSIKLIGTIESDNSLRLLEFDKKGNILGIITGTPEEEKFNGIWFSPKSRRELKIVLKKSDKLANSESIMVAQKDIFGDYRYSYGKFNYNGEFNIEKIDNNRIVFEVLSVGEGEAPSIAQIERDTIKLENNSFIYKLPESGDCEFKITFFKGFVYIKYLKGICDDQFGMNATIEGIYIKQN